MTGLAVAKAGFPTFGDEAPAVATLVTWEVKDATGVVLDQGGRTQAFQDYLVRMMVKSCNLDATQGQAFVNRVLVPNGFSSCYQFLEGFRSDPATMWVTLKADGTVGDKIKASDQGILSVLKGLVQSELKSLAKKEQSLPGNIDLQDPMSQMVMMASVMGVAPRGLAPVSWVSTISARFRVWTNTCPICGVKISRACGPV